MRHKTQTQQAFLFKLLHGRTNFESGVISLYEHGWTVPSMAEFFRVPPATISRILAPYGWQK